MTYVSTDLTQVAVVVVGWRNEGLIRACVRHVRAQWSDVCLIAVQCGGTVEPVPGANVTLPSPNLGYAGGNNLGIREAIKRGAQFIVVLNSDAFPQPGALELMSTYLLKNPTVGLVGAKLHTWDEHGQEEINCGVRYHWVTGLTTPILDDDEQLDYPAGALLMFRADALKRVGGFDANLFLYGEEIDWCERARGTGFQIAVEPAAEAIHLRSATVSQAMMASTFFNFRNHIIVRRRYGAAHGAQVEAAREVWRAVRLIAGHAYHRRFRLMWPIVVALKQGLGDLPPVTDDPNAALAQQVWETRDTPS